MPPSIRELLQTGLAAHRTGNLAQASLAYEAILKQKPGDAEALHLLGGIALAQGDAEMAVRQISAAVASAPQVAIYRANLAAALLGVAQPELASKSAQAALALDPSIAEAHNHLACARVRLGQLGAARESADKAVSLAPNYAEGWLNLANLLSMLGEDEAAQSAYARAAQLNPSSSAPLISLGALFLGRGEPERAVPLLQRALSLDPKSPAAHNNLGLALQWQSRTREARRHYGAALRAQPNPLWAFRKAAACPIIPESRAEIERWRREFAVEIETLPILDLAAHIDELASSHAEPPYHLAYQGAPNLALRQAYAARFTCSEPLRLKPRRAGAKPRIAMLSTPGHEGIFLRCNAGLIAHWDGSLAELDVIAPKSALAALAARPLPVGVHLVAIDTRFRDLLARLAHESYDLLYLWEVGSDGANYFLPFFRPAHLVGTGWGTSESPGHPALDFYLSSRAWDEPEADTHYSEPLLWIKRMPICYEPSPAPQGPPKRLSDFGLPDKAPVLLCVQNLFKLHPDFDLLLARLLQADPRARVGLVSGKRDHWSELLKKRLARSLGKEAERVSFLPRLGYSDYQHLLAAAPCLLDSLYFSGGNTSFEALCAGTPVITLPGCLAHGRFTLGCYRQMALTEWIAVDEGEYTAKALALAADPEQARAARARVSEAARELREDLSAARQFQAALLEKIAQSS